MPADWESASTRCYSSAVRWGREAPRSSRFRPPKRDKGGHRGVAGQGWKATAVLGRRCGRRHRRSERGGSPRPDRLCRASARGAPAAALDPRDCYPYDYTSSRFFKDNLIVPDERTWTSARRPTPRPSPWLAIWTSSPSSSRSRPRSPVRSGRCGRCGRPSGRWPCSSACRGCGCFRSAPACRPSC